MWFLILHVLVWAGGTWLLYQGRLGGWMVVVGVVVVASLVLSLIHDAFRKARLRRLVARYMAAYGAPPPGLAFTPDDTLNVGGVAANLAGVAGDTGTIVGGVLGIACEGLVNAWNKWGMTPEQKALYDEIRVLSAGIPHALVVTLMSGAILLSGMAIWVLLVVEVI